MSITSVVNDTVTSVSVLNAQKPLPPTITNYSVGGLDDTALDPAGGQTVQINGTGFLPGATITFDGSAVAVVTYVSPNQLTFTSPAKSAGTYTIYVVNADGGTAIYIPGIIYSVLPTWTTGAGTLGSYYETQSISNTVVASGDAPITYSLYSGSLPTGSTLAANGVITGTAPVDSSSTTYSFTIQATDAQLQDSTRSFSLTINTDVVTWVSPANATTYTSAVDSAIANVTLSATDAAGYAVTYSANALPTGLSLSGANISGTPTVIADSSTLLTATAATTNRSATRTINWSITVANDAYFEYNTLLIPGSSTTFVDDASTNNFAITINGDTKPNNFNPYTPGYYSNYFDGSGDYLTLPDNTAFDFPGDFTIEAWVYLNTVTGSQGVYSSIDNGSDSWVGVVLSFSGTSFLATSYISGDDTITHQTAVSAGRWYHIAIVRNGSSTKSYLNGVQSTTTTSGTYSLTQSGGTIGSQYPGSGPLNGYISNLRVVKGTAVYTSSFTPSTTPLTAISGTSLLTCQSNRFIDNSTNNFTVTVTGNTTVNSFDPFIPNTSYSTYGSGYFDGTGDYLTVPSNSALDFGTGDFTVEAWVNLTAVVTDSFIISATGSGGFFFGWNNTVGGFGWGRNAIAWDYQPTGTTRLNQWQHVAVSRSGTSMRLFVNGAQVGTTQTNSTSYNMSVTSTTIGSQGTSYYWTGYLNNIRVVKGTAVYTTAFTPPTSPLTAIANTSLLTLQNNQSVNNSVFLDNSTNNFLVTRAGNTTQGTFSPYGGNWSNYFDGASDAVRKAGSGVLTASGDVTIECWIYPLSTSVIGLFDGGSGEVEILRNYPANKISRQTNDGTAATFTVTANQWQHFACTFTGGNIKVYINGSLNASGTYSSTYNAGSNFDIGTINGGGDGSFNGYISNFRVTKSVLYTTTFTPSTTPLTPIANTSLLTCQSNRLIDNSINNYTITKVGGTTVQRFSPFNPSSVTPTSYSGYFDGSGDYLSIPDNVALQLTADFTIEFWIYTTSLGSTQRIIVKGNSGASDYSIDLNTNGTFSLLNSNTVATSNSLITINSWNHLALTRSGSTCTWWINGVSRGTFTYSNSLNNTSAFWIGQNQSSGLNLSGYLSNLRVVKGTAVYTSAFTPSTTPLTAISGTSLLTLQSTTFIDNSTNNFTVTAAGNSKPTIQNPFGYTSTTTNGYSVSTIGGSGYFDGSGDYLSYTGSLSLTGAFTVQGWFYNTSTSGAQQTLFVFNSASGNGYGSLRADCDQANTQFNFSVNMSTNGSSWATTLSTNNAYIKNVWNHFAVTRDSSNAVKVFINGVQIASGTQAGTLYNTSTTNAIGCNNLPGTATNPFNGYISDLQLINGTALYNSNFVPPSAPLTAVQNTTLLTNMTNAGIYDAAMMTSMETLGDAKLSTAVTKFGGSSMYFDGNDNLSIPLNTTLMSFGTGDFTVEGWVYHLDSNTYSGYYYGGTNGLVLRRTDANKLEISHDGVASIIVSTTSIPSNQWVFVTGTRSGSTVRIFINGTVAGTATYSSSIVGTSAATIGSIVNVSGYYMYGYIDDFRITKGYARYTSNFTPPTSAFPVY